MELVEARIVSVPGELNLKFHLVLGHGQPAHLAGGTDAGTTPRAIRASGGEFPTSDYLSGFLSKNQLVRHSATPQGERRGASQRPAGRDAESVSQRTRWEAATAYRVGRAGCYWTKGVQEQSATGGAGGSTGNANAGTARSRGGAATATGVSGPCNACESGAANSGKNTGLIAGSNASGIY